MEHKTIYTVFSILLGWLVFTVSSTTLPVKDYVTGLKCPKNEVVIKCKRSCPPDTCDTLWLAYSCAYDDTCVPGCTCAKNYLRTNVTGVCIPQEDCLPLECANDPNAKRGCGNRCKKTCADYKDTKKVCSNICRLNGCDCKDGFVYDQNVKKCVKPSDCTPQCTRPYEKYVDCLIGQCVPKTCDDIDEPIACPDIVPPCPGGCICKEGYLRNSEGICIEESKCPVICGLNAHYNETAEPCPATCANTLPLPCKALRKPGCECNEGYVLNINSECVKIEDCRDQAGCTANQTWSSCNAKCPDSYCPPDDQPQPVCDAPNPCPGGCICKINYRINATGQCILAAECPPVNCTRPNEEWDRCPSACLAENCEDINNQPATCNTLVLNCQPKCVCKKNHFRNNEGICVPAKQCSDVCNDPNAHWRDCPTGPDPCPATCQYTLPIPCDKPCSSGCQCNTGYVLSEPERKCVKIEECPEHANCKANETWVPCNHHCPNTVCPTSDANIMCRPPNPCPGGCGCKLGYRRNYDGVCILARECPPIKCTRSNEIWEPCSPEDLIEDCSQRKETIPTDNIPSSEICYPRCICKKGFCRNNTSECIPENK